MKVALVHDYLNEFGGAERVLEALAEIWPNAPIYTAFYRAGSPAYERFKRHRIVTSWAQQIPGFTTRLHSPLRFLAPQIWQSFDFAGFDVVISSSSWFLTKGIRVPEKTLHISYIHTPPRYLYGYATKLQYQKHWPVKIYAALVNKRLREFDYVTAQSVDLLIANSKEVQARIQKFWRRDSIVIYPPVEIAALDPKSYTLTPKPYLLTGGRLVSPKHFDLAIQAANRLKLPLKIFGTGPEEAVLRQLAGPTVEFVGNVNETGLARLYAHASCFLALADDEDFGITPVEAMLAGTPVVAYPGGGYLETVVEGKTGTFIRNLTAESVTNALQHIQTGELQFNAAAIREYARQFSKSRFQKEIKQVITEAIASNTSREVVYPKQRQKADLHSQPHVSS